MVLCLIHLILTVQEVSTRVEVRCAKVKRQERIRQWGDTNGKEDVAKILSR